MLVNDNVDMVLKFVLLLSNFAYGHLHLRFVKDVQQLLKKASKKPMYLLALISLQEQTRIKNLSVCGS